MMTGRLAAPSRPIGLLDRATPAGLISSGVSRPSGPDASLLAGGKGLDLVGEDQVRGALLQDRVLAGERHQLGVLGGLEHRLGPPRDLAERGGQVDLLERSGPSTCVSTCPVSASTGERSTFASHSPVSRLVAPGPGDRQARRRPAGELAVGGRGERRGALVADPDVGQLPASSWRRSASARPRFEWPTIPKTWRTPQLTIVSAITSLTVRTCGGSGSTPT